MLLAVSPTEVKPGATVTLTVVGADDDVARNVVFLNGAPIPVREGTLRDGRGTLTVTVPPDAPSGPCSVSFAASGERSNHVTLLLAP